MITQVPAITPHGADYTTQPDEFVATFPVTIEFHRPGCYWGFDLDVTFDVSRGRTVAIRLGVVHYDEFDRQGDDWREWCRRDHPEQIAEFETYLIRRRLTEVHRDTLRVVVRSMEKPR